MGEKKIMCQKGVKIFRTQMAEKKFQVSNRSKRITGDKWLKRNCRCQMRKKITDLKWV